MQRSKFNLTVALSTTLTTNLLNPAGATGGVNGGSAGQVITLYQINLVNKTSSAASVSLWKGLTGANTAGTEICNGLSVAGNSIYTLYLQSPLVFTTADFLVGGAGTASAITLVGLGEIGV